MKNMNDSRIFLIHRKIRSEYFQNEGENLSRENRNKI